MSHLVSQQSPKVWVFGGGSGAALMRFRLFLSHVLLLLVMGFGGALLVSGGVLSFFRGVLVVSQYVLSVFH